MPKCFVVMGYGEKTDFQQNKTFDLDKSYRYIIKPAVEAAGYTCVRADEIQHAGNINTPMYEQLFEADLVIADLSTANLNAFFELGVRYALKPRTTIVIAERGFKIPFDMGQVVIRHYEHLGKGIDYGEVERMKSALAEACREVVKAARADSPVYTFLANLTPPSLKEVAAAEAATVRQQTKEALADAANEPERAALTTPLATLMEKAMAARAREDFKTMREILAGIRAVQGESVDPFVVQQLALATYKSKDLEPKEALLQTRAILTPLSPETSSDPETLGLWGAIHKRLFDRGGAGAVDRLAALDAAIWAYEKGFYLKNDSYNGINFAFLLDTRAAGSAGDDAIADRVQARRVRRRVLAICEETLRQGIKGESQRSKAEQEYWLRATQAEALFGLGRVAESDEAIQQAAETIPAPEGWMIESTRSQLAKLGALLAAGGRSGGDPGRERAAENVDPASGPRHPDGAAGGRRKYVKREGQSVVAVPLALEGAGFTYEKWGGTQRCKAGDWIVNNGGDIYTVDRETFSRTYREVGKGTYAKVTPIWAEVALAPGQVQTKEGVTKYRAGDYLVFNEERGGDAYAVAADTFEAMYESAE